MSADPLRPQTASPSETPDRLHRTLAEVEREHILAVLDAYSWNRTRAAKVLGIDVKTLYNKLKTYRAKEPTRERA